MTAPAAEERRIAATIHGTYLVAPPPAGAPHAALVGFHGYGETAADHLAALRRIPGSERWLLVAVQALHPFYRKDGTVVASWMTRFDRETAIGDNTRYAAAVLGELAGEFPTLSRWGLAGFSQGVAMAYRAAAGSPHPIHALVALAGDVPPDVAGAEAPLPAVLVGRGDRDSWYSDDKLVADLEVLAGRGAVADSHVFAGGHEWGEDFLRRAGEFLARHLEPDAG
ncbi:MAG TPA: phospholipase [Thermoanaerobaculia bacterium]|nr:phospholipase [Thermoanaerobaculia bacterium]